MMVPLPPAAVGHSRNVLTGSLRQVGDQPLWRRCAMLRLHGGALLGKAGYTLSCIIASLVLVASGVGYCAQSKAESTGNSSVAAGGPSTGAMNILVMGLESRTYWSGKPLPRYLTNIMHIGNNGGNATNTLILIHIFDGGKKAVGFSIPRDDY